MRRIALVGGLVVLGWLAGGHVATAAPPVQQGWWLGPTPLDVLLDPLGIPGLELPLGQVSAVDVPADGLLVQGGPAGPPAAYAAVAFDVGTAAIEGPLRLEPSSLAVSVPGSTLVACPLDLPAFTPVQGGRRQDAPPYDCFGAVNATAEPDGTYLVDVATLRRGERLALALLPGSPTARIVLQAPGEDALPLGPAPSAGAPAAVGVGGVGVAAPPSVGPPGPAFGAFDEPPSAAPAGPLVAAPAASTPSDDGIGRNLLFGGIAAAGAALWWGAGQIGLGRRRPEAVAAP